MHLENSYLYIIISLKTDLAYKEEFARRIRANGFSLKFISSQLLKKHCRLYPEHNSLVGLANGNLYFITSPFSSGIVDSKKKVNYIFHLLVQNNVIVYGVLFNCKLYNFLEFANMNTINLVHNLNLTINVVKYWYVAFLINCTLKSKQINTISLIEENYVYN